MRIAFSRFPSSFLHRDLIRHHHLVFTRHTVTQPTAHPPPQQRSMRRRRIHPSLQLKVRNQNLGRTVSNRFIPISDRNYLGDSPQNISPKITPQESPPNIYSAGIHQVCGGAETYRGFYLFKSFLRAQENVGGTTYFYSQEQPPTTYSEEPLLPMPYPITPLSGHAYTPPTHVNNIKPKSYHSSSFFMPEELRNSLLLKNEISNNIEHDSSNLPLEVDNYHSLTLLEASNLPVPSTSTYKATHSATGLKYCLRRLHGMDDSYWARDSRHWRRLHLQALGFNRWN